MITEVEVHRIAEEAATAAVEQILQRLDIDPDDDKAFTEFRKDMQHLRSWREATTLARVTMIKTAVGVVVTGLLGLVLLYFKPLQ
jgi:DNA primase